MKKAIKAVAVVEDVSDVEPVMFKSLSEKDRMFCREYVKDWNGRRAYQSLYPNYNDNTAKKEAHELVKRKRIQAYCKYLSDNVEINVGVSKTWVMEQHLKIARSSIAHLHDTWITLNDFDKLTDEQKYCIEEITTQTRHEKAEGEDGEVDIIVDYIKLKLCNKQKSLDAITAMMGYAAPTKVAVTGMNSGTIVNIQINVYNSGPPLADSEDAIKI